MKDELQEKLFEDFPKIFIQKDQPMKDTCMCWGIECGDGWELLIRRLCEKLEDLCARTPIDIQACQVKEKLGGLRFYVDMTLGNKTDWWLIEAAYSKIGEAERNSYYICEVCGSCGKQRNDGWIRTLCEEHYVKPEDVCDEA